MASHSQKLDSVQGGYAIVQPTQHHGIIISTGNDIPGYEIVEVHGVVYGMTVRSRNFVSNIGAGLKSLVGGELKSWTKMVVSSRDEAVDRLVAGVRQTGANAVYAFRFDNGSIGEGLSEVCCYGTAVTVRPISSSGKQAEAAGGYNATGTYQ